MNKHKYIICVEDSEYLLLSLLVFLNKKITDKTYVILGFTSYEETESFLKNNRIDCSLFICDHFVKDTTLEDFSAWLIKNDRNVPIICLSGYDLSELKRIYGNIPNIKEIFMKPMDNKILIKKISAYL